MAKRKHIVCITFDFDSMSGFIARGLTSPTPISRGEFGAVAVPRILKLLANYRVPASFFIPGFTLETYPRESRMIADAGCEIGHHGWTHRPPATLTREQEEEELARANESIKALTGQLRARLPFPVVGFERVLGGASPQAQLLLRQLDDGARLPPLPRAAGGRGRAGEALPLRPADEVDRDADKLDARRLSAFRVRAHEGNRCSRGCRTPISCSTTG